MCLLRAFAIWWLLAHERHEDLNGFIFRKKIGIDGISVSPTDRMVGLRFVDIEKKADMLCSDLRLLPRMLPK
jgi:hypothetical protein